MEDFSRRVSKSNRVVAYTFDRRCMRVRVSDKRFRISNHELTHNRGNMYHGEWRSCVGCKVGGNEPDGKSEEAGPKG